MLPASPILFANVRIILPFWIHRGYQFIKDHLRMQDVKCYWKQLLKRYAKLMQWKPQQNLSFQEVKP